MRTGDPGSAFGIRVLPGGEHRLTLEGFLQALLPLWGSIAYPSHSGGLYCFKFHVRCPGQGGGQLSSPPWNVQAPVTSTLLLSGVLNHVNCWRCAPHGLRVLWVPCEGRLLTGGMQSPHLVSRGMTEVNDELSSTHFPTVNMPLFRKLLTRVLQDCTFSLHHVCYKPPEWICSELRVLSRPLAINQSDRVLLLLCFVPRPITPRCYLLPPPCSQVYTVCCCYGCWIGSHEGEPHGASIAFACFEAYPHKKSA